MAEQNQAKEQQKENFRYFVRIANTDLDGNKPIGNALRKIKGVSFMFANMICSVAGIDKDDLKRYLLHLTGAENGVIFIGQGLLRPQKDTNTIKELLELVQLVNSKQQKGRMSVVMVGGHYNMAGFDHVALSHSGKNHSLQFSNNQLVETSDTIVSKIQKEDFDCSIIVGSDPISHFPSNLSKKLMAKPLILIDNKQSATSYVADITLPSAITGIECGGLAFRPSKNNTPCL